MKWQEFLDRVWEVTRKQNKYRQESDCPSFPALRAIDDLTFENGALAMFDDVETHRAAIWWFAFYMLEYFTGDLRKNMIRFIQRDPPRAALLYLREPSLTDEEDKVLYRCFTPSMPYMKKMIDAGKAKRAKRPS